MITLEIKPLIKLQLLRDLLLLKWLQIKEHNQKEIHPKYYLNKFKLLQYIRRQNEQQQQSEQY